MWRRYQINTGGWQRHICVRTTCPIKATNTTNTRKCCGRQSNPRPTYWSQFQRPANTPPSHTTEQRHRIHWQTGSETRSCTYNRCSLGVSEECREPDRGVTSYSLLVLYRNDSRRCCAGCGCCCGCCWCCGWWPWWWRWWWCTDDGVDGLPSSSGVDARLWQPLPPPLQPQPAPLTASHELSRRLSTSNLNNSVRIFSEQSLRNK